MMVQKKISMFAKFFSILYVIASLCIVLPVHIEGAFLYTTSQYNKLYNEKIAIELELQLNKRQYNNNKANLIAVMGELNNNIDNLNMKIQMLKKQQEVDHDIAVKRIKEMENIIDILKEKSGEQEKQLIEENRKLQKQHEEYLVNLQNELKDEQEKHLKELSDLKSDYERKIVDLNKRISNLNNELSEMQKFNEKQKEELNRMEQQANEIEKKLANEIKKGDITLKRFHDRLVINIDDRICFDSGSSELKKDVMPALQKISAILNSYSENRIIVEGHTDNIPINTSRFRDNWQLSTERALSVLNYLLRDKKLNPTRFSATGYSEYNPILPNDTTVNRALNRRVDIVVVSRSQ